MTLLACFILVGIGLLVAVGALVTYGQFLSAVAMFSVPVILVAEIVLTVAADLDRLRLAVAAVPLGLAVVSLFLPNETSENIVTGIRRAIRRRRRQDEGGVSP
ncbi:MAG: hypothetical protein AAGD35_05535 [Actinomycetota bacterium]